LQGRKRRKYLSSLKIVSASADNNMVTRENAFTNSNNTARGTRGVYKATQHTSQHMIIYAACLREIHHRNVQIECSYLLYFDV